MARLPELPTPCLVLDRLAVERNVERMKARALSLGVRLRPHVKTAKSIEVARLAVDASRAITVSTLREADHFLAHGLSDITWAVGISPDKLGAVAERTRSGAHLRVITDDIDVAHAIAREAERSGALFEVLIELDVGQHRGGIDPEGSELLAIAGALGASSRVVLEGVLTHAGHSYGASSVDAIRAIAEDERRLAVLAAQRLRAAGHAAPTVSVGSTPTITHAAHLEGVTEVRPGVYVFGDLFQAALGSCAVDDIALSVLTTVIGVRRRERTLVIDAGALALSKDRSMDDAGGRGYGELRDIAGRALPERPVVESVSQEHGLVRFARELPEDIAVGARFRVLPNHACLTAAMHERYEVVLGESDEAAFRWERVNGWW